VCDTLCLRSDAGMVFAKNSDRPPDESQVLLAHAARSAGGALHTQYLEIPDAGASALVGSHPTWLWGIEHGVNEHGVAIGNERIWTIDNPRDQPYGLLGMDLVRLGLEQARTADDALAVMTTALGEHGQGGSGEHHHDAPYFSSFLIADARGGWLLETSARTWAARPVGDGASISNRVTLTTDWTTASTDVVPGANFDEWRSRTIRTSIADQRLAATRACVARRSLRPSTATIPDVIATLRDHGNGPWSAASEADANPVPRTRSDDDRHVTVCMHLTDDQATTASIVVDLRVDAPPRVWACLGSPCTGVYIPVFAPAVPDLLRDPAQWQRFARLRDRVESDAAALTKVRGVLEPVERDLWEAADEADRAGTDAPKQKFTAAASRQVDAALTTLGV
jgi:secernin